MGCLEHLPVHQSDMHCSLWSHGQPSGRPDTFEQDDGTGAGMRFGVHRWHGAHDGVSSGCWHPSGWSTSVMYITSLASLNGVI